VVVHLVTTGSDEPAALGFTVGGAVGNAVVRNRVRRRLRHAAAGLLPAGTGELLRPGDRVVVRATPAAAGASYAELGEDLRGGLDRARAKVTSPPTSGARR